MTTKQFLPLPYGKDVYSELKNNGCYFVDKTPYLKNIIDEDESNVMLFTRPRRFGKTLFMSMVEYFLKINSANPGDTILQQKLFKDTKILEDREFCAKYMGQHPVICLTLKGVQGVDFEDAYYKLAEVVSAKANEYSFLKDSPSLDEKEKAKFEKLCDEDYLKSFDKRTQSYVTSAIISLARMLYKHFKKQVYVLIDEYAVPLAKAQANGYHKDMVTLMSSFLGFLKDPQKDPEKKTSIISKVVITDCLKVAKNSIFTGVNNLTVNTVISTDMDLTGIIGFTKDETYKFLEDYEMDDYDTDVKNNYDGYKFCDKEMFCPWDVVNFIKENYKNNLNGHTELVKANNYWVNSSSDSALGEYLGYLTDSDTRKMQDLVDGKSISFILNDSMNYDSLSEHDPNDFWSLLLHTGYLTLDWDKSNNKNLRINTVSNNDVFVRIPNLEIKNCFKDSIQRRFNKEIAPNSVADEIATALLNGDNSFAQTKLRAILMRFISLRDNATKAPLENYYHGYLNGLFTNCSENFFSEYHSNNEAGNGYSDISFADTFSEKAVIIELKVGSLGSDLVSLSKKELSQIEEKNYAEPFLQNSMTQSIFAYGIAFSGKNCLVACKKLK